MLISGLEIPLHSCGNRFLSSRHCSCHRERGGKVMAWYVAGGNRCSSFLGTVVLPCHQWKSSSPTAKLRPCVKMEFSCSTTHHGSWFATRSFQRRDARTHNALGDDLYNEVYRSKRYCHQIKPTPNNFISKFLQHCIVLDIEGTTTPISFVTDILFPYARDNVRKHLTSTYESEETQEDIKLLRAQVLKDLEQGVPGSVPIPLESSGKGEIIDSLVANVESMIRADRKVTALKELQGHIWRSGFQNKKLESVIFDDVSEALKKWHANGIKVYIYSSGSREAQRLIFGNTAYGDLRKYLCGFFDTTIGNKRESRSYFEISQSIGVDDPNQILFVTDVYQEAIAAKEAGLEVIISIRPGNGPLPENHGFRTVRSFHEI